MCSCSDKDNVQHLLFCKNESFITKRHNVVGDITATFLSDVCKDVELEPTLIKLQGVEEQPNATTSLS